MVQNAGFVLKNRQDGRRENLEIVVIYLLFSLYFRWNGAKIRAML